MVSHFVGARLKEDHLSLLIGNFLCLVRIGSQPGGLPREKNTTDPKLAGKRPARRSFGNILFKLNERLFARNAPTDSEGRFPVYVSVFHISYFLSSCLC